MPYHTIYTPYSTLRPTQVEKLLEEVDASAAAATVESPEALDARVRLYERVASEVSRLNFHAAKGAQLPFVLQLGPRIRAATAKLQVRVGYGWRLNKASSRIRPYPDPWDWGGARSSRVEARVLMQVPLGWLSLEFNRATS